MFFAFPTVAPVAGKGEIPGNYPTQWSVPLAVDSMECNVNYNSLASCNIPIVDLVSMNGIRVDSDSKYHFRLAEEFGKLEESENLLSAYEWRGFGRDFVLGYRPQKSR
jgi:hypothetical protein